MYYNVAINLSVPYCWALEPRFHVVRTLLLERSILAAHRRPLVLTCLGMILQIWCQNLPTTVIQRIAIQLV